VRNTTSSAGREGRTVRRTMSRMRLFRRFRSTELRPYLGTTMPTLGRQRREAMNRTSRWAVRNRFPRSRTASSSPSRVRRFARGKNRRSDAGVLRRQFDGQPLAPLFTATAQHFPSPLVSHPRAKAVCLDSTLVARTISRLAHVYSKMLVKTVRGRTVNVAGS